LADKNKVGCFLLCQLSSDFFELSHGFGFKELLTTTLTNFRIDFNNRSVDATSQDSLDSLLDK